jgi:dockerin type I repeat protein
MNHYNVLATIEDVYGLAHIGGAVNRRPVSDIFTMSIFPGPLAVPNEWSTAQADTGNLFPLFSSKPIRYQQVFDAAQFSRLNPGGGLINRIAFRGHGPGVPFTGTVPQLQVNLSTTSKAPDALSSTFVENVGSDDAQVFSGPLQAAVTFSGDPTNFEITINFTTPFYYDPAKGNLLLDVRNLLGGTEVPPSDQELDGTIASGDSVSRVFNYGDAAATAAGQSGGVDEKDTYGLVTRFNTIAAVSRKAHGSAGAFDVALPLLGKSGIECRTGDTSGEHQMVVTFSTPVTFSNAQVTQGTGSVSSMTTSGNQVFLNLTGVANAQTIKVTLFAVNDGTATNNVSIPMSILLGDVNGDGNVTGSDVNGCKTQVGATLSPGNFRNDVNTNGSVSGSDVNQIKAQVGTLVP